MDVILREDVKDLGRAGQLVKVKPGYARNYLLPRGLAYEATEGNRRRIEAESKARTARLAEERDASRELAERLAAVPVTLSRKAGEGGRLFGSITSQDIADALAGAGVVIDKRKIELEHPIKTTGLHTVQVNLHHEVKGEIRLTVVAE
jgi:large subunit ribosomal protein L9